MPGEDPALSIDDLELGERVTSELGEIGERREIGVGRFRVSGKRRRPSGERPPLPRELNASGIIWLIVGTLAVALWISLFAFPDTTTWWEARDAAVSGWLVDLRSDIGDGISKALHALGSPWFFRPLRWATFIVLVFYRRWRHLLAALVAFVFVDATVVWIANAIGRPRPFVEIIGTWFGYSHPALPVASLAVTLGVMGYSLVPRGRWRDWWFAGSGIVMAAVVLSRVYLGVDHLTDGVVGGLYGLAIAVLIFRLWVPESVFPVSYHRGVTAHLDVGGARGDAIRSAIGDQLGWQVVAMEPFGLAGSGGSTPLKVTIAGGPSDVIFAKLYAASHLRADRWYKLGRTILYGSLEDEVRFTSVRRLVEYEDYMLLTMRHAGLPSAEPYGVVEITPEREYLIVTEFLQDAREIGDAEVDAHVIDDCLLAVRNLWDAGLAHRDIKPSNIMVKDGHARLIDVAFGTLRPSPWRQAVDLANMMLVLGLNADPETVYENALRYFAPDDIAEAFAATHGVTLPGQLAQELKERKRLDGTDLIETFRSLAPPCEPISLQRVTLRRVRVLAGVALLALFFASFAWDNIQSGTFL
jgi:tRNA A-37 threonylcarbamoyl transferase component Bud32/membrane-associated phospholipid phosphatase